MALKEGEAVWIRCVKGFSAIGTEVFWFFVDL